MSRTRHKSTDSLLASRRPSHMGRWNGTICCLLLISMVHRVSIRSRHRLLTIINSSADSSTIECVVDCREAAVKGDEKFHSWDFLFSLISSIVCHDWAFKTPSAGGDKLWLWTRALAGFYFSILTKTVWLLCAQKGSVWVHVICRCWVSDDRRSAEVKWGKSDKNSLSVSFLWLASILSRKKPITIARLSSQ